MSTLGALVGKTTIDSLRVTQGISFYTLLAAQPSTGKSAAQGFAQEAITKLETFLNVPDAESMQVNAPTIESFIRIMRNYPAVLGRTYSNI